MNGLDKGAEAIGDPAGEDPSAGAPSQQGGGPGASEGAVCEPPPSDEPAVTDPPAGAASPRATPEQLRAIETRDRDVVVAAGAGSGKTFVLVQRFMGHVADGVAPDRLLTITFTDKAAREMRERIGEALESLGIPDARRVAEGAWISTIHGFCARLLRERALEAGVDPAFKVLTEVPAARFRRLAFVQAQRSFRAAHPGLYDGLIERVRWGKGRDGATSIRRHVFQLHEGVRAAGAPLRELRAGDLPVALDRLDEAAVREALANLVEARQRLQAAIPLSGAKRSLRERTFALSERTRRAEEIPLDGFRLNVHRELRGLVEQARGGGALASEIEVLHDAAEACARAYAEGPARALGRALEDLLARFDRAFRRLKAEHSALDFTDLEERARALLQQRDDVRAAVQERFAAVLVDEFQDTSRLQQELVDCVRVPDGLFAVGDAKQSIYGFRHAEVRGLIETTERVRAGGGEVVELDRSFRTRPEILGYVDEVFERAWGEAGSEVPHQPLVAGVSFDEAPRPCVEVLLGRGERLAAARSQEARAVAARLATLIEGQQLRGTNPLRAESYGRALRYADCAILLPTTTQLGLYERALRARGVPYRVATGRGFYQAREVIDAILLLRVCADVNDDLSLVAFLRSPAVGLEDDELAAIAGLSGEGGRRGALFEALERSAAGGLQGKSARRAQRALDLVRGLRDWRGRRSTRAILARGLETTGLWDGSLLRSGDVRGYANLEKLLDIVEELEREGVSGPGAIAGVLDDLRRSEAREAEANVASDDEDAVSVLTVHGSKGLEWPLVVVGDCGRYAPFEDDPVMWDASVGVTVVLRDPEDERAAITPSSLAHLAQVGRERRREESKRLLYVATTRARDHLIVAGAQRSGARTSGDWLSWTRAPVRFEGAHLGVEQDVAAGGLARAFPTVRGVKVRSLEVAEENDGAPLQGVRGPAANAPPVLDARACQDLATGRIPRLPEPSAEALARASALLERTAAGTPAPARGLASASVSDVLTWTLCPRRSLFESLGGDFLPAAENPTSAASEGSELPADVRGTLAHEALSRFVQGRGETEPEVEALAARAARLLAPKRDALACRAGAEWASGVVRWFGTTDLGRRACQAEGTLCEQPFEVRVGGDAGLALRGVIDLLIPSDEGYWVVDYKSHAAPTAEVEAKDALQVRLYALALEAMGERVAGGYVVQVAERRFTRVDRSRPAEDLERLTEFRSAHERGEHPPRPGEACASCSWRSLCKEALLPGAAPREPEASA